jgi:MFS family permease
MNDVAPTEAATLRAPLRVIVTLCAIIGGLQVAEEISNNVLPLTLHRFTPSARLIGLILAIHPMFGFIAQPVVGILGDRIWTRIGRRAFFLVVCAPLAAGCMLVMPHMPTLAQLVVVVVLFQLFLALLWGSDHPLITDLVPATQRTLVRGWMMAALQLSSFLFVRYAVGRAMDRFGEASVYQIAAGAQILLVSVAALFLQETRVTPAPRPKLTPRRYVMDLLGDPVLRKFALLGFVYSTFVNIVFGFAVLFAVQTVRITKADFGSAWSLQAGLALFCAIPLGFAIERVPKQWALVTGFVFGLGGCACGYFANDAGGFYPVAVLFGFGWLIIEVTLKPFFSEFLPRDIVGQLTGAYNICYATGRITALVGAGWLVSLAGNNYRVIWLVALVFGTLSAVVAATIPDRRYADRRRAAVRPAIAASLAGVSPPLK